MARKTATAVGEGDVPPFFFYPHFTTVKRRSAAKNYTTLAYSLSSGKIVLLEIQYFFLKLLDK